MGKVKAVDKCVKKSPLFECYSFIEQILYEIVWVNEEIIHFAIIMMQLCKEKRVFNVKTKESEYNLIF